MFDGYSPGRVFSCTYCYSEEELDFYSNTALNDLSLEHLRRMIWETCNHWESSEAYRRFLPALLDAMGPPTLIEDLFPEHLFECLLYHGYRTWPEEEKRAVTEYLESIYVSLDYFDERDKSEWKRGMSKIKDPGLLALKGDV